VSGQPRIHRYSDTPDNPEYHGVICCSPLRGVNFEIAGRGRAHTIPRKLEHCRRSGRRANETPRIPMDTRLGDEIMPSLRGWRIIALRP
jgi:hypothetical protein